MEYFKSKEYQESIIRVCNVKIKWEIFRGRKILITGASGMVGSFLVEVLMKRNELFSDNIHVYAMSRSEKRLFERFSYLKDKTNLTCLEHDVTKPFMINESVDYVIHAASNTHPYEYANDPVGTITTNVIGFYNLLEYAKQCKDCHVLLLSSVEIYGENRGDQEEFDESYCGYIDCNTMRAGYPESKRTCETMLQAYRAQYNLEGSILRLCRLYGPNLEKDDSKALSQFIFKGVKKQDIVLKSEGKQFFSYLYIADAVKAILYTIIYGKDGEAYNAADEASDITLAELAQLIAKQAGTKVIFDLPDEKESAGFSKATKAILDSTKLQNLGWKADYTIETGITEVIEILKCEER